ncbi:MAG: hypothetical protein ACXIU8_16500 [Alkalilacustris sp.]
MTFTLVAGLSSSGKSTWLAQEPGGAVILPTEFGDDLSLLPPLARVHYNTLRYADNTASNLARSFTHDPFLRAVLRSTEGFDLVYLAAPPAELIARIRSRRTVERGEGLYPSDQISAAMEQIDHRAFHSAWLDLLVPAARSTRLMLSTDGRVSEVSRAELLAAMCNDRRGLWNPLAFLWRGRRTEARSRPAQLRSPRRP